MSSSVSDCYQVITFYRLIASPFFLTWQQSTYQETPTTLSDNNREEDIAKSLFLYNILLPNTLLDVLLYIREFILFWSSENK